MQCSRYFVSPRVAILSTKEKKNTTGEVKTPLQYEKQLEKKTNVTKHNRKLKIEQQEPNQKF